MNERIFKTPEFKVTVTNKHINAWYDSDKKVHPLQNAIEEQHPDFKTIELGGSSMAVIDGSIYDCLNVAAMDALMHAVANDLEITPKIVPCELNFHVSGYSLNKTLSDL